MSPTRAVALLALVAAIVAFWVNSSGADFESETFSADLAEGWSASEDVASLVEGSAAGSLDLASAEVVTAFVPDDFASGMVMVARYSSPSEGVPDEATLEALAAGGASGLPAGTPVPTRTVLDEEPAYELNVPALPGPTGALAGSARMLLAVHDGDAYAVVQVATDSSTFADLTVGFDAVVDSWEWE